MSAVVLGAGLVLTACSSSPVKFGSAAIVGDQRITIATLDTEVNNLNQAVEQQQGHRAAEPGAADPADAHLAGPVQDPGGTGPARPASRSRKAQAEEALASIYAAAKSSAETQGIPNATLDLILAANGIPPNLADEVGRYQAIDDAFAKQANGGQEPTSTAAQTAVSGKLTKARCEAAKALNIQINPQFGELNYDQLAVVSAPGTVFRTAGPRRRPLLRG